MGRETGFIFGLNAGVLSREALQRVDQAAARIAGEVQENYLPRVLGAAIFRPGTRFVTSTRSNLTNTLVPFIYNSTEKAVLELYHDGYLRVIADGVVVSRDSVSTAIANGTFAGSLASWTVDDETGGSSVYDATDGPLHMTGNGVQRARIYQSVTVSAPDQSVEHGVRVVVGQGPVLFSVGTAAHADDIISEQSLGTGEHSLAFTPGTSPIYFNFANADTYPSAVTSCEIEAAGDVLIPTPWDTANKCRQMQYAQSGDIVYCAHNRAFPHQIERRSQRSWSVVRYEPVDGPLGNENVGQITLTAPAKTGEMTITASRPLFNSGHVGSVWRITHGSSAVSASISTEDTWTDPIRVTGLTESEREFSYTVTPGGNTVHIQRAYGSPTSWEYYANVSSNGSLSDGRENEIIYYRIGIPTGGYVSGSADVGLTYANASQSGIFRVKRVFSTTTARIDVLRPLGSTDATKLWNPPEWVGPGGYPGAVALFDGRLWWGARDKVFGSISDGFNSFDLELEGDSGTINRSIATGPFERVLWMKGLQRLCLGTATEEVTIRSSAFDEPVTPTEFTARSVSQQGSSDTISPVRVDGSVIYVQRNGKRVYELRYLVEAQDYASKDLTRLVPEMCEAGVVAMAVQRQPDTRVWFILDDGTAACLLYEPAEDAIAWTDVTLGSGTFESVCVLPGEDEDEVYFTIRRGSVRTVERMAKLTEVVGGDLNLNMDGHVIASSVSTVTGLDHLDGIDVVAWGDGEVIFDQDNPQTVASGSLALGATYDDVVVGVPYDGRFKSVNLNYGAQLGVALGKPQKIAVCRILAKDIVWNGTRVGSSFTNLRTLNARYDGRVLTAGEVIDDYTQDVGIDSSFSRAARICLETKSPYPATFLGLAFDVETGEGIGGGN